VGILIDHGSSDSLTGKLIRVVVEGFFIEAGIGGDPCAIDMNMVTWVSSTWFTATVRFFQQFRLSMRHNLDSPQLWTERDQFLMEVISATKAFDAREMKLINEVRMYLQVMTLADILTLDGRHIKHSVLQGHRVTSCSGKAYCWPAAASPTSSSLRLWNKALQLVLRLQPNSTTVYGITLGSWMVGSTKFLQWWYNETSNIVYSGEPQGPYYIWECETRRIKQMRYSFGTYKKTMTTDHQRGQDWLPVVVIQIGDDRLQIQAKGTMDHSRDRVDHPIDGSETQRCWSIRYVNMQMMKVKVIVRILRIMLEKLFAMDPLKMAWLAHLLWRYLI
jgi:hypothetical protein